MGHPPGSLPTQAVMQLQERRLAMVKDYRDHADMAKMQGMRTHTIRWTSGRGKAPWEQIQQLPDDSEGGSGSSGSWGGDCCCLMLTKGAVNKGMTLRGTIAAHGVFTGGVYFLLEDMLGELVKVGVYNTGVCDQRDAKLYFAKGAHIAVHEPFFKFGSDGKPFVRVDNPSELQASSPPRPVDAAGWHVAGNALWSKHRAKPSPGALEAASICWQKSVDEDRPAASVLLSNRAQANIKARRHGLAARDALAALLLDRTNCKAGLRLTSALNALEGGGGGESSEGCWWEERSDLVAAIHAVEEGGRCENVAGDKGGVQETWSSLKERGNAAFRDKEWDVAAETYSKAIGVLLRDSDGRLTKIMCNLALASCEAGDAKSALGCATAAVVVSPACERAWVRRAQALEACGFTESAAFVCTEKGTGGAHAKDFQRIHRRVAAKKVAMGKGPTGGMDTEEMRRIRAEFKEIHGEGDKGCVSVDQQEAFLRGTQMLSMLQPGLEEKMYGRKVDHLEDFRKEVPRILGGWPAAVDPRAAQEYLRAAWVKSEGLPHQFEMVYKRPEYVASERDVLKRLNGRLDKLHWYLNGGSTGDVYIDKDDVVFAGNVVRYDFSNQPYRKEVLLKGTTHVAVGFVDLGILLVGNLREKPGSKATQGPLVFCGYEACAFNCAKTAVLWQLLSQPSIDDEDKAALCVAQVWFSSTWTREAARAFASAVGRARKQHPEGPIAEILDHWAASPGVSLAEARRRWLSPDINDAVRSCIAVLADARDRAALASYELTGDFCLGGSSPHCGSVCWWDCPDGTQLPADNQCALGVLNLGALALARAGADGSESDIFQKFTKLHGDDPQFQAMISEYKREIRSRPQPQSTFVAAAEQSILLRVRELMRNAKDIHCKIFHSRVEDAVHEIADMRPWSISWSNILDYMSPSSFHKLARRLSVHGDVVHYGYTMNWHASVKGTHLVDFSLNQGDQQLADFRTDMLNTANHVHSEQYALAFGKDWKKIMRSPPAQNPMNTVSALLCTQHYKAWVDSFFRTALDSGPAPNVANIDPPAASNPFSCYGSASIHMTWTYDQDIVFNFDR